MPKVDQQDNAVLDATVPHLVLERVVKDNAPALGPRARLATAADGAAIGHDEAEVARETRVGRAAVGAQVRGCTHNRKEALAATDEPELRELGRALDFNGYYSSRAASTVVR